MVLPEVANLFIAAILSFMFLYGISFRLVSLGRHTLFVLWPFTYLLAVAAISDASTGSVTPRAIDSPL